MKFRDFLKDRAILENGYREMKPRVSIVMPTFCRNQEGLLDRCLQSVLAQSFKDFEFIIVDDGSIDGTEGVVRGYAERDPRILYFRHAENSGLPAVRADEGILLARAPYIAFMFDDNFWHFDALESMILQIESDSVDVVYGNTEMVMSKGESILFGTWPLTLELLEHLNTIPNAAVMCRRDFFVKYGLYDPHLILRRICDWDLWLRALHLGGKFKHIDKLIGSEFGTASDFSIGRTVQLDFKTTYAYMICEEQMKKRAEALRPETIPLYDLFDPERVMPYLRDFGEWERFEKEVYRPFFESHPKYTYEAPAPHNRRYDSDLGGYKLNAAARIFQQKRRILIVANRFSRLVREWRYALSRVLEANVLSCTEWNVAQFHPSEIDLVILLDCSAPYLHPLIRQFRDHGVPLIYLVVHGRDNHNLNESDPLQRFNLGPNPHILRVLGTEHYFSMPGIPWSEHHRMGADELMILCDQVFSLEGRKDEFKGPGNPHVIDFIPNQVPEREGPAKTLSPRMYLGDAEKLTEEAIRAIERILEKTPQVMQWEIYIHPDTVLPLFFRPFREKIHLTPTHETLPTLVKGLRRAFLGVPEAILCRYSEFHKNLMEEDLVANQSALVGLDTLDGDHSAEFDPEYYEKKIRELQSRNLERSKIYWQDSRHLHLANLALSSILRKKASRIQSGSRGHPAKALVLLNSQLLAGSEMVGVLIGKALARLGWDVQMSVPESHDYPDKDEKDINGWLQERGLAPVVKAPYGISQMSFFLPKEEVAEKTRIFQEWLEAQAADVLICTGFIAEAFLLPQDHRLVYLGLMQPWGFHQDLMTFLRDRVHGMFSDSRWAAREWSEWVPPPMEWIPTIVETEHFGDWNKTLPSAPVRIAVGGTIQPRKRQLEALQAAERLIDEGYDIRLNFYGYELEMMEDYIQSLYRLAEKPGLRERVFFHGLVNLRKILQDNHICLMNSIDESLPLTLLFAMAGGLTAVGCPSGGIPEVVINGQTGFLAKGFSVGDIVEVMKRALGQREQWPALAAGARKLLTKEFSEQIAIHRFLKLMIKGAEIALSPGRHFLKAMGESGAARIEKIEPREGRTPKQVSSPPLPPNPGLSIGPEINKAAIRYSLFSEGDHLAGFRFMVVTFDTAPQGIFRASIRSRASGQVLREINMDLGLFSDSSWITVRFEPISNSRNKEFDIFVSAEMTAGRCSIYEPWPSDGSRLSMLARRIQKGLYYKFPRRERRAFPALIPLYEG